MDAEETDSAMAAVSNETIERFLQYMTWLRLHARRIECAKKTARGAQVGEV
jgi:hypothetical protein